MSRFFPSEERALLLLEYKVITSGCWLEIDTTRHYPVITCLFPASADHQRGGVQFQCDITRIVDEMGPDRAAHTMMGWIEYKIRELMNTNNGWISVRDRLPNDPRRYPDVVLIYPSPMGDVGMGYYSIPTGQWIWGDNLGSENRVICRPTHWQPRPKPPQ